MEVLNAEKKFYQIVAENSLDLEKELNYLLKICTDHKLFIYPFLQQVVPKDRNSYLVIIELYKLK